MRSINYVRRCKNKECEQTHSRCHAAIRDTTLCGIELDYMWFVESSAGMSHEDITCPACQKILKERHEKH
jgi:hypothetical protein